MSIWNKLHQQTVKEGDVLSQYDSISIDNKIIEYLKIGLEDAQGNFTRSWHETRKTHIRFLVV